MNAAERRATPSHAAGADHRVAPPPRLPVLGWRNLSLARRPPPIVEVEDTRAVLYASSGRAAILLALEVLGVRAGDRVLVPTYHCPTMIAPVVRLGATPVFYPVDASAHPDLAWIRAADLAGVKAMIAVHFFGLPRALGPTRAFCDQRGIGFIEDCAHAFFGSSDATPVGGFGHLAITSAPKFFPVNEGGCLIGPRASLARIALQRPSIAGEARALADAFEVGARHGRWGIAGHFFNGLVSLKRALRQSEPATVAPAADGPADHPETWLDEKVLRREVAGATRWIVQHADQHQLIEQRRANFAAWNESMQGLARARPLFPALPSGAVPYVFPLHVADPERAYKAIRAEDVPIFRWDVSWSNIPRIDGDCGRPWLNDVFQLGCHQDLSVDDVRRLATIVRRILAA